MSTNKALKIIGLVAGLTIVAMAVFLFIEFRRPIPDFELPQQLTIQEDEQKQKIEITEPKKEQEKDTLMVLGGSIGSEEIYRRKTDPRNDVWLLENDNKWIELLKNNSEDTMRWGPRENSVSFVFDDKIWLVGGSVLLENFTDIWQSNDGINWVKLTTEAPSGIVDVIRFNNKFYALTVSMGDYKSSVYSSIDGKKWAKEIININMPSIPDGNTNNLPINFLASNSLIISFKDKLWSFASFQINPMLTDLPPLGLISNDGNNWDEIKLNAPLNLAQGIYVNESVILFKNKLWLFGSFVSTTPSDIPSQLNLNYVWSSDDGINWHEITGNVPWTGRQGFKVLNLNNEKILIIGGLIKDRFISSEIWSSEDGLKYTKESAELPGGNRSGYAIIPWPILVDKKQVDEIQTINEKDKILFKTLPTFPLSLHNNFKNKIMLLGGNDGPDGISNPLNDIWASSNGINWDLFLGNSMATNKFSKRFGFVSLFFKNRLFAIGGIDKDYKILNDIWASDDGKEWFLVNSDLPMGKRAGSNFLSFKEKIWSLGGVRQDIIKQAEFPDQEAFNDIWSSEDGKNWLLVTGNAPWPARFSHRVIVFKDKIWLIGGIGQGEPVKDSKGQPILNEFGRPSIYINRLPLSDIWSSDDGKNWNLVTANSPWGPIIAPSLIVFKDSLYLFDQVSIFQFMKTDQNLIWKSNDGINWQKVDIKNVSPWDTGSNRTMTVFGNKILAIGGQKTSGEYDPNDPNIIYKDSRPYVNFNLDEIWSSEDGINWDKILNQAPWGKRSYFSIIK